MHTTGYECNVISVKLTKTPPTPPIITNFTMTAIKFETLKSHTNHIVSYQTKV